MPDKPVQRFDLTVDGRAHRVEITEGALRREIHWYVDDALVATARSAEEKVTLKPEDADLGLIALRFSMLGHPRRVTLFEAGEEAAARAATGLGGIDLDPEPGSRAAAYDEKVRAHPRRYAAIQTAGGVAKVVVPLLFVFLAAKFTFSMPLPDVSLPSIPWPDLPDLPSIPWPDISLPDWSLPGWVREVLEKAKYVWPVVLAYFLARAEIRRRRKQDELKAGMRQEDERDA
jgi:hypothetical protein